MTPTDVERVYEALAEGVDRAGAQNSELFLAKLALLLSHELGDAARAVALIKMAEDDLEMSN